VVPGVSDAPTHAAQEVRANEPTSVCVAQWLGAPHAGGPGWVHGVASSAATEPPALDLGPYLVKGTPGARKAPSLFRSADYAQHVNRSGPAAEYNLGGIDYAPVTFFGPTEICPVAAGAVIGVRDNDQYAGIVLDIAHGLGWISE
jgi:hypothetical protein